MLALRIAIAVVVALLIVMSGRFFLLGRESQAARPANLGVTAGRLADCPAKPCCVSSQAPASDPGHLIAPLALPAPFAEARKRLVAQLVANEAYRITEQNDQYLRAEFRTRLFGFVDDVELYFPPETPGLAHVRSASRVGHSDLGANRRRIEALRAALVAAP